MANSSSSNSASSSAVNPFAGSQFVINADGTISDMGPTDLVDGTKAREAQEQSQNSTQINSAFMGPTSGQFGMPVIDDEFGGGSVQFGNGNTFNHVLSSSNSAPSSSAQPNSKASSSASSEAKSSEASSSHPSSDAKSASASSSASSEAKSSEASSSHPSSDAKSASASSSASSEAKSSEASSSQPSSDAKSSSASSSQPSSDAKSSSASSSQPSSDAKSVSASSSQPSSDAKSVSASSSQPSSDMKSASASSSQPSSSSVQSSSASSVASSSSNVTSSSASPVSNGSAKDTGSSSSSPASSVGSSVGSASTSSNANSIHSDYNTIALDARTNFGNTPDSSSSSTQFSTYTGPGAKATFNSSSISSDVSNQAGKNGEHPKKHDVRLSDRAKYYHDKITLDNQTLKGATGEKKEKAEKALTHDTKKFDKYKDHYVKGEEIYKNGKAPDKNQSIQDKLKDDKALMYHHDKDHFEKKVHSATSSADKAKYQKSLDKSSKLADKYKANYTPGEELKANGQPVKDIVQAKFDKEAKAKSATTETSLNNNGQSTQKTQEKYASDKQTVQSQSEKAKAVLKGAKTTSTSKEKDGPEA